MDQIDPSMPLSQEECGFLKRMEKHTIVPIQEEDVHWAKKYNMHVEDPPQESHATSELEKSNIASTKEENLDLAIKGKDFQERTWKINGTCPVFSPK